MEISNLEEAKGYFVKWTGFHFECDVYKSRVYIGAIYVRPDAPYEKYCVTFKRGWYHDFSYHFPQVPDKGYGQITSLNLLLVCEKEHIAWLVAVMPNGTGYKIEVLSFLKYWKTYGTNVPHLPGEVAAPIKMWERMFPMTKLSNISKSRNRGSY